MSELSVTKYTIYKFIEINESERTITRGQKKPNK